MKPKITVITPSFNQGKYIKETIDSVLSQSYSNLEYIIIDGGSTDETMSILMYYSDRIQIVSEKDNGQTDAINKGLRMATGDIVCWLNSDDYFLPNTLNLVAGIFKKNDNILWVTGDCQIVNYEGKSIHGSIRLYKRVLRFLGPVFFLGLTNAICQPSTFWRKELHSTIGYLNENLKYTMDYDLWFRLNQIKKPEVINSTLASFRIHELSKGGSQFIQQFDESLKVYVYSKQYKLMILFHQLHNYIIKQIYKLVK